MMEYYVYKITIKNIQICTKFKGSQEFPTDLVYVDSVVPGAECEEAGVRREADHVNGLGPVLVHAKHLPRVDVEDDPLAGECADDDDLAVRGEGGGLGLLPHVVAPHHAVAQRVPQVDHSRNNSFISDNLMGNNSKC